jgi:hypothetical protein
MPATPRGSRARPGRRRPVRGRSIAGRDLRTGDRAEPFSAGAGLAQQRVSTAEFLQTIAPFSNTFAASDRIRAADREIQALKRQLATWQASGTTPALTEIEQQQIRLRHVTSPSEVRCGESFQIVVDVQNGAACFLSSQLPYPIALSYHWLSEDRSAMICFEGLRSELSPALPPRTSGQYPATVRALDRPGRYCLRVTILQELVAWFDSGDAPQFHDIDIVVT